MHGSYSGSYSGSCFILTEGMETLDARQTGARMQDMDIMDLHPSLTPEVEDLLPELDLDGILEHEDFPFDFNDALFDLDFNVDIQTGEVAIPTAVAEPGDQKQNCKTQRELGDGQRKRETEPGDRQRKMASTEAGDGRRKRDRQSLWTEGGRGERQSLWTEGGRGERQSLWTEGGRGERQSLWTDRGRWDRQSLWTEGGRGERQSLWTEGGRGERQSLWTDRGRERLRQTLPSEVVLVLLPSRP
ncbi:uncharacterized protein LOC135553795 [Oncorhynchus masou masou]|uniref:uncharacterized protein LOC135553795 n=1 Tax=Oncorhynchus masou masou TaxID=90313 RepID=UPI0031842673